MFERFTDRAREVIALAQDEARALKHNYKDLQASVCCAVTDIRFLFNRIGHGVSQAEWDFVEREILPLIEPLDRL